jgi:hypothetical protein
MPSLRSWAIAGDSAAKSMMSANRTPPHAPIGTQLGFAPVAACRHIVRRRLQQPLKQRNG